MEPTVRTHPTRRLPTALVLTAALLATGCSEQSDDGREPAATESSGTRTATSKERGKRPRSSPG